MECNLAKSSTFHPSDVPLWHEFDFYFGAKIHLSGDITKVFLENFG
jgi:hypothetical protein